MLTFEKAFEFTNKVSSTAVYYEEELRLLFDCAMEIPKKGQIVEIGAEYGRSTSLLIQVARERSASFNIIEMDPKPELLAMLKTLNYPFVIYVAKSHVVIPTITDFLHIDGGHEYEVVMGDLEFATFCHGWTVCHDYGNPGLPGVKKAVDEYVATLGKGIVTQQQGSAFAFKEL